MRTRDLEAEWNAAVSRVKQPHLDRIRSLGVSPAAVAALGATQPAFGVVHADPGADGLYVPGDGPLHVVMPVFEHDALIDLVAWRSDAPTRWWLRSGLGWLLNTDASFASRWDGASLKLHATPLDWLRAGAEGAWNAGAVVLDWDAPDVDSLRSFGEITCGTRWLAATLKRALTKPARLPIIHAGEALRAA
jgi:hypothetical protein